MIGTGKKRKVMYRTCGRKKPKHLFYRLAIDFNGAFLQLIASRRV